MLHPSSTFLSCVISATVSLLISLVNYGECELKINNHIGNNEKQLVSYSTNRLLVLSLVNDILSESFVRFNQSAEAYDLNLSIIDTRSAKKLQDSTDDLTVDAPPPKQNFKLIQKSLASYKNESDLIILLTVDTSNLILNGNGSDILDRFYKFDNTRILFAADINCWPDPSLESKYPTPSMLMSDKSSQGKQRFLDSRVLIGYATTLWELFNDINYDEKGILSTVDTDTRQADFYYIQLIATEAYLNEEKRSKLGLALDHHAELFESLHSTNNDVELELDTNGANLKNSVYKTQPVVIHGSGPSQVIMNSLGNYLGRAWTQRDGCRKCNSSMISLKDLKDNDLPNVLIGVFIEEATPFLEYFFQHLLALNYPKQKIHLYVHNSVGFHANQVDQFWHSDDTAQFASKQLINRQDSQKDLSEVSARELALKKCKQLNCDYYFALDSVAHLELPDTLRLLIEANRTIIAPLLNRPRKLWSNFWGSITIDGYYSRSQDYIDLVSQERLGIWNVPLIMNAYLINGKFLRSALERNEQTSKESNNIVHKQENTRVNLTYYDENYPNIKPALIFSRNLRLANIFQYVTNQHDFGHLVDPTSFNTSRLHSDFYQLENNMIDWEKKYLHENYSQLLDDANANKHLDSPCQDVYWFPLVNSQFCRHLIEIMENFGQWSSGTNNDPRIEGGYESVPTRDIHFRQVGLHDMWLTFLREYVMPIQLKEYIGYEHDPPRTDLAFVVRYHPAEQPSLRPHHDSSTYTLNIALNEPGTDYQGGGCRFVRYNCSVTDSRRGWALIHPGRLTHYHEGLPVTNGTRYILVTFIDP